MAVVKPFIKRSDFLPRTEAWRPQFPAIGAGFDFSFGGALLPVRDHRAQDAYTSGDSMILPNALGAGYPPEYRQDTPTNHPLIETTNGLAWLSSPGIDTRVLKSSANVDINDTDNFFLFRRLGAETTAYLAGRDGANVRIGFFSQKIRTTNLFGTNTGTVTFTALDWHIIHARFRSASQPSFYRLLDLNGSEVDRIDFTDAPSGPTEINMLMGSYYNGDLPIDAADAGLRRMLTYSHSGGIPTAPQYGAIIAELAVDGAALDA
ncbi:MAG: hypothetical protein ACJA1L_000008 [Paracoccaceae bacterium]|jgi:hypothetical protein